MSWVAHQAHPRQQPNTEMLQGKAKHITVSEPVPRASFLGDQQEIPWLSISKWCVCVFVCVHARASWQGALGSRANQPPGLDWRGGIKRGRPQDLLTGLFFPLLFSPGIRDSIITAEQEAWRGREATRSTCACHRAKVNSMLLCEHSGHRSQAQWLDTLWQTAECWWGLSIPAEQDGKRHWRLKYKARRNGRRHSMSVFVWQCSWFRALVKCGECNKE